MKKKLLVALFAIVSVATYAQIPYFAEGNGKGSIYGYAEVGFHPGKNAQEFNTYWQYGITDWIDAGFDYDLSEEYSSMGFTAKFGKMFNQWIGVSAMIQPWFALNNNFNFDGLSTTLILQGGLTRNGKLFWLSNSEFGFFNDYQGETNQMWYLGYEFEFKNEDTLTPMAGIEHNWKFDSDVCPTVGLYYNHKRIGVYLWGGDLLNSFPRCGVALDVIF